MDLIIKWLCSLFPANGQVNLHSTLAAHNSIKYGYPHCIIHPLLSNIDWRLWRFVGKASYSCFGLGTRVCALWSKFTRFIQITVCMHTHTHTNTHTRTHAHAYTCTCLHYIVYVHESLIPTIPTCTCTCTCTYNDVICTCTYLQCKTP